MQSLLSSFINIILLLVITRRFASLDCFIVDNLFCYFNADLLNLFAYV